MSDILDDFGRGLMAEVRDRSLDKTEMILDGSMKSERARALRTLVSGLPAEDARLFSEAIIDGVLHDLLCYLEVSQDFRLIGPGGVDVAEQSDGFAGELYSSEGWIEKFSSSR